MIKLEGLERRTAGSLTFSLGCDFHLSYENLEAVLSHPGRYTIGNSKYLLVEFSDYAIPLQINEFFARLFARGLTPVLTHPERNPILQQDLAGAGMDRRRLSCAINRLLRDWILGRCSPPLLAMAGRAWRRARLGERCA